MKRTKFISVYFCLIYDKIKTIHVEKKGWIETGFFQTGLFRETLALEMKILE